MTSGLNNNNVSRGRTPTKSRFVHDEIAKRIRSGFYRDKLPGVNRLSKEFEVNPLTVVKAIENLEAAGIVEKHERVGTFVKHKKRIALLFLNTEMEQVDSHNYSITGVFAPVLGGVNAELDRHNYSLLIKQIGYKQVDFVERLKEEVDGLIIIAGLNLKDEHLQQFSTVPWVRVMGRGELNHESVHVTYDNAHVGRIAADYLIKSGCTRLVYFGGVTTALFRERYDEFSGSAAKQGIEVCLIEADSRSDSMEIIVGKARNRLPELLAGDKFTGIFSSADIYCGAIYQELYRLGIEPIFDVPVISCNNNRFYLNGLYPKPGVIDIRMFEIGERAAQILLESVAGKNYKSERMVFSPRLIIEDEEARASLKVSQLAELL